MATVYTRQNKCCYTIFHVSNSIIIFVIKYIQSVYYVTLTRILYNTPLYCAKMFIYVQIKRTRSDIATTVCAMAELFVISRSYLFATLIDNKTCSLKTEKRERVTLSSIPFWFIKIRDQLSISLLIIKRRKKYCRSLQFSLNIFFTEQGNFDIFKLSRENVSN